jgi:hypothetical protein
MSAHFWAFGKGQSTGFQLSIALVWILAFGIPAHRIASQQHAETKALFGGKVRH